MAIEAPLSKYKRNNILIYIAVCLGLAGWFAYDGYLNQSFISEHTTEEGNPNGVLVFNQKSPPAFVVAALLLGGYLYAIRQRKLVADENELIVAGKERIPYSEIEKIDKTYFGDKGFFTIVYRKGNGTEAKRRLSDRQYDNLKPILELLVEKIT
ncbi:MAG: hypothetical protein JSW27_16675 [Phycisphaerales bacterium]|nr:MAG: hypothetical protein JSW27_16675 [Phycisphaerales bacterium]